MKPTYLEVKTLYSSITILYLTGIISNSEREEFENRLWIRSGWTEEEYTSVKE
jgi:hypothetical protein